MDGKTLRGSQDKANGKSALQLVSAWATANHLVLGQVKVDEQSNEITAIPALLRLLEVHGCIVSIELAQRQPFRGVEHDYAQTVDKDHGRIETRQCWVVTDADYLAYIQGYKEWAGMRSVIMVRGRRPTTGNAPYNLAIVRHLAVNLLRQEKTARIGMHAKRLKAAWDEKYRLKVLFRLRCDCPG